MNTAVIINLGEILQSIEIPDTIVVMIYLVGINVVMFGILSVMSILSKRK